MLRIKNLNKSYGSRTLFRDVSVSIEDNEKIGLIGRNGSGKSTFLKMLLDRNQYQEIDCANTLLISSLEQNLNFTEPSLREQVCTSLGQESKHEEWRAETVLMGLGFSYDDLTKAPGEFSSGFQIRIRLAQALVQDSHLLFLDEPTNYLDITSLRWLKKFLKNWDGAFILVTHDRSFMEEVVTHTFAIHRQRVRKMKGGPQKIIDHIAMDEEIYEKTRQNQEKKQKKTKEFISRFRAGARSAGMVQSRIKALDKQGTHEKLEKIPDIAFRFHSEEFFGNNLMKAEGLTFGYTPEDILIEKFSLRIQPGEKIAVIGKNGKGKSTLLRMLAEQLEPNEGIIKKHVNAKIGYFGSDSKDKLLPSRTILEELRTLPNIKEQELRNLCGALLFSGDDSKKHIEKLSGGEKSRLCLGKVMLYTSHLLLLDEPTNHLDMESCDALTKSLQEYKGALIFVTHDENMIAKVATRLVVFDNNTVTIKDKTYSEFLATEGWSEEEDVQKETKKTSTNKEDYLRKKEQKKELNKVKNTQKKLGAEIEQLEAEQKNIPPLLQKAIEEKNEQEIKHFGGKIKTIAIKLQELYQKLESNIDKEAELEKALE
ncbi:MAG: ATP-binding cassette domain-containing protein [Candidatus Gracilibacteria bacterium]|nr:ATP-binding cassette domain-containing protein [Candidatus Gracilibacteria bacterium]